MKQFSILLLLTVVTAVTTNGTRCLYGATVDNALFQAAFLMFDNVLMLRARLSQTALLASTLHCMGITQEDARRGLQMFVMEGNGTECEYAHLYDPLKQTVSPSQTAPVVIRDGESVATSLDFPTAPKSAACTPEGYEANPWVCMPGDISGKFGELTLGLDHLLFKLTNQRTNPHKLRRFLSSNTSVLRQHLSLVEEEVRVHVDQLAIPTCQLEGKYMGLFCEDGHLIGCGKFERLNPQKPGPAGAMEIGTQFLIRSLPAHDSCAANDTAPLRPLPPPETPSWTDRVSKEIGNLPDYVSNWWEDVKRKSKEAWKASQIR